MLKLIRIISFVGLAAAGVGPVHAWWDENSGDWKNYRENSDARGYGWRRHPVSGEGWKPWKDRMWQDWRAPWSHDGSRWGAGPWSSFGESFGDLMGEVEVDANVRVKGKTSGSGETEGEIWNYGYSNNYRGHPSPYPYGPVSYPYGPYTGPYPYYRPQAAPYAPYPPRH